MHRTMMVISGVALLWVMQPAAAQPSVDTQRCDELQSRFSEARARHDAQAMAEVFAEDAVRVTPDGVFQGRDAIRGNLQALVAAGLRDFTAQRVVSRREGELLLVAGEWHANLGDVPLHGYYSAILACGGDRAEMLEETTNVAAPPRR